jgi:hypothetical protein
MRREESIFIIRIGSPFWFAVQQVSHPKEKSGAAADKSQGVFRASKLAHYAAEIVTLLCRSAGCDGVQIWQICAVLISKTCKARQASHRPRAKRMKIVPLVSIGALDG